MKTNLSILPATVFFSLALAGGIVSQGPPRTIAFTDLEQYVDDKERRHDGELLIVTDVAAVGAVTFYKPYGMYTFQPDVTDHAGDTFCTSAALAKSLSRFLKKGAATERIYCTLVQFKDDSEAYRSPFATKVEGLDADGKLKWTAVDPQPIRVNIRL
jgi:hypothetical protein